MSRVKEGNYVTIQWFIVVAVKPLALAMGSVNERVAEMSLFLLTRTHHYGIIIEKGGVYMNFTFRCSDSFYAKLKEKSTEMEMGLSQYIRYALITFWNTK